MNGLKSKLNKNKSFISNKKRKRLTWFSPFIFVTLKSLHDLFQVPQSCVIKNNRAEPLRMKAYSLQSSSWWYHWYFGWGGSFRGFYSAVPQQHINIGSQMRHNLIRGRTPVYGAGRCGRAQERGLETGFLHDGRAERCVKSLAEYMELLLKQHQFLSDERSSQKRKAHDVCFIFLGFQYLQFRFVARPVKQKQSKPLEVVIEKSSLLQCASKRELISAPGVLRLYQAFYNERGTFSEIYEDMVASEGIPVCLRFWIQSIDARVHGFTYRKWGQA